MTETPAQIPFERRSQTDRRRQPTPMLSRYTFFGGRREGGRRSEEDRNIFVDRYGQGLFLASAFVLLLNLLDAFFTLFYLSYGGKELNPVAQFLLDVGPEAFLLAKTLGIGVCVAYLVLVSRFKGAKLGLAVVLSLYTALLGWHLFLFFRVF